ncbi:MAG: dienelactone hydrolase family protein [Gemmatimonadales bacterium]
MIIRLLLAAALVVPLSANAQDPPAGAARLRYDLRPGDHLVYRQTLEAELDNRKPYGLREPPARPWGDPIQTLARAEWTAHLVVAGAPGGAPVVGVQRNRTRAELLRFQVGSDDRLAASRAGFEARHRTTAVSVQALQVDSAGQLRRPLGVVREWPSKMLWAATELVALPPGPVKPGERFAADNPLGFTWQAETWETVSGEACLRVSGGASATLLIPRADEPGDVFHVRYWFCPARGLVRRLEMSGEYPSANFEKVVERVTFELVETRPDESPATWLANPETREALVAAWQLDDALPVDPSVLELLLDAGEPRLERAVLSLAWRRGLPLPPPSVAARLDHTDPRIRRLAVRLLGRLDAAGAPALVQRVASDSNAFVREAVRELVAPPPTHSLPTDAALGFCSVDSTWVDGRIRTISRPSHPAGTFIRGMGAGPRRGWPFIVRVPDDYRGDRPVPLLVYLAGNAGGALEGMQIVNDSLARTGYLIVYPNSGEWWWRDSSAVMVSDLIDAVQREYAVDPRRIYLTGLSNGGTGTFHYATLFPHKLTAAVSAMGAGVFQPGMGEDERPFPRNTTALPLAFLHGEADSVILAETTRRTVQQLGKRSAPVETHYLKGKGHELGIGREEGLTLAFFERHTTRTPARAVHLQTRSDLFRRQGWVEILERSGVTLAAQAATDTEARRFVTGLLGRASSATVEGEITADNEIRLHATGVQRLRLLLRRDLLTPGRPVRVRINDVQVFAGDVPPDCTVRDRSLKESPDPFLAYDAELLLSIPAPEESK